MARTNPELLFRRSRQMSTQAALIVELVKVAAHTAPSGANNNARSGLPEGFRPAETPEALKPRGIVIPPDIGDHGEDAKRFKIFQAKINLLL